MCTLKTNSLHHTSVKYTYLSKNSMILQMGLKSVSSSTCNNRPWNWVHTVVGWYRSWWPSSGASVGWSPVKFLLLWSPRPVVVSHSRWSWRELQIVREGYWLRQMKEIQQSKLNLVVSIIHLYYSALSMKPDNNRNYCTIFYPNEKQTEKEIKSKLTSI